nr:hypothetical protein [Candidatus Njordarchaeota archaeon]
MSKEDFKKFFDEYVFGFIFSDIKREIELARSGKPAGNFLSALGLLFYTEFMRGILKGSFKPREAKSRFDAFFNSMGQGYKSLNRQIDVYNVFRCGMAHQYFLKGNCTIAMLKGNETLGIGKTLNRQHYFVVERYFEDFAEACLSLYNRKMMESNPLIPDR